MLSYRRRLASAAVVAAVLTLSVLLAVPASVAGFSANPDRSPVVVSESTHPVRPGTAAPANTVLPGSGATAGWSGRVVRTLLPNYNGSVAGNFPSTVLDLEVGTPAFLPSTGALWWPELPVSGNSSTAPPMGPTLVYNVSHNSVVGLDSAVANASALLYDSADGRLYAADPLTNSVAVLDPSTGAALGAPIPVGSDPRALGYDNATAQLFVANAGSNNVSVINTFTDRIAYAGITVGSRPVALAVDPTDGRVYVANAGSSNLTLLVIAGLAAPPVSVPLYLGPAVDLAYSASTGILAAVEPTSQYLTMIDAATNQVVLPQDVKVGTGATAVTTDGSGAWFVVAYSSGSDLSTVEAASPFNVSSPPMAVGPGPSVLATDPATGGVIAWCSGDRTFYAIDPGTATVTGQSLPLVSSPGALAYDASNGVLYVSDPSLPGVELLDPFTGTSVAAPIRLDTAPTSLAFDPVHGLLYVGMDDEVAAYYASNDTLLQSNHNLPGSNGPLVLVPSSGLLWVGRPTDGQFVALAPTTLATTGIATAAIGVDPALPSSLVLDPVTDELFAVNFSSDTVRGFNGSSGAWIGPGLSAGSAVTSLAFDAADGLVYAAGEHLAAIDPSGPSVVLRSVALAPHATVAALAYDPTHELLLARTLDAAGAASLSVVDGASPAAANTSLLVVPAGLGAGVVVPLPTPAGALPGAGATVTTNSASSTVSVLAAPPSIVSYGFAPTPVDTNGTTTSLLLATGGAGPVAVSYAGLPPGCSSLSSLALSCVPSVPGTYNVTATVSDSLGQVAVATARLEVGASLAATVTVGPAASGEADVGVAVPLEATMSGGEPPYSALWSFGDGGSASGLEVNHTFATVGPTTVTLTASDAGGSSISLTRVVTVVPPPSVVLSTDAVGPATDVNLSVAFQATVTGGTTPGSGSWSFGDGTPSTGGLAAQHAFLRPGLYSVTFHWVDASGVRTGAALSLLVHPALAGHFAAHRAAGASTAFSFVANLSGGTPPYTVSWSFGDGSSASGDAVQHAYARPGSYTANASVVDAAGAVLVSSVTVTIVSSASASWLPGSSAAGLAVGLMIGGAAVAAAMFAVERSIHRRRFRPPRPYVPPPGTGSG